MRLPERMLNLARMRVGVRGTLHAFGLAESPPHPNFSLRVKSDLSPQAGRGAPKSSAQRYRSRVSFLLNICSEFSSSSRGTFASMRSLISSTEEDIMKRFGYVLAALGAIAIAAPSIASAETVVVKRGGYHHGYGARAEYREHRDRGWHEGWRHRRHADKVVIIKHHRHE